MANRGFSNSPWIRGAPHRQFSSAMRRIRSRHVESIPGRPGRRERRRQPILDALSPAICDPSRSLNIRDVENALKLYHYRTGVMPVEFTVAAYRFGHSMVCPGYRVNEVTPVVPIFDQDNPQRGLNAFGEFNKNWTIDWQRFVDLGRSQPAVPPADRVQIAYKIDTSIVEPLTKLPVSVAGTRPVQFGVSKPASRDEAASTDGTGHRQRNEKARCAHRRHRRSSLGPPEDDPKDETTTGEGEEVKHIAQIDDAFKGKCPCGSTCLPKRGTTSSAARRRRNSDRSAVVSLRRRSWAF